MLPIWIAFLLDQCRLAWYFTDYYTLWLSLLVYLALDCINTLARIYDQQNAALYYQGRSLPPPVPFDWVDWSDDKFFEKVPQLMRLEQSTQDDLVTDCLAQIPKLT